MISKHQPLLKNRRSLYLVLILLEYLVKESSTRYLLSILSGKNGGVYNKHRSISRYEMIAYMTYIKGIRMSSGYWNNP
jgi:hypothetical protein